MAAIARYKLAGLLPVGKGFRLSSRIGSLNSGRNGHALPQPTDQAAAAARAEDPEEAEQCAGAPRRD